MLQFRIIRSQISYLTVLFTHTCMKPMDGLNFSLYTYSIYCINTPTLLSTAKKHEVFYCWYFFNQER